MQAEGGEQGDSHAGSLLSWSASALQAVQAQLQDGERLFLDDVYVVCALPRVNAIYGVLQHELFTLSSIRVHHGKTQVGNRGSVAPLGIELQAVATVNDPMRLWRGDPTLCGEDQIPRFLGTPLGHPDFVRSQLSALSFFRVPDVGTQVEPHDGRHVGNVFAASLVEPASHVMWCHTGGDAPVLADLFEGDPR